MRNTERNPHLLRIASTCRTIACRPPQLMQPWPPRPKTTICSLGHCNLRGQRRSFTIRKSKSFESVLLSRVRIDSVVEKPATRRCAPTRRKSASRKPSSLAEPSDIPKFPDADFWFLSLGPPCELADSLADSFGELDVVGFSECRKDGWAQLELELECFAARERAGGGFKHVERAPVVGQALDIKRHDGNAGFAGCYGSARVPWPVHVCLKIAVGGARRENAEDRLLPPKDPRVLEELDHGVGHQTLLNRENDPLRVAHEAKEMFEHPVGGIRLRDKLRKLAARDEYLRAHQHAVIGGLVDVVAG